MKECSFHPSISPNSLLLSSSSFRSRSKSPIHSRLYLEGLQAYKKKDQLPHDDESKPNIKTEEFKKNQRKMTERLVHSKMGMEKVKNFEEEFDFKPKIRKDKYYVAAKEREAVEMEDISKCCLGREEGGEGRGERGEERAGERGRGKRRMEGGLI